MSEKADDLDKFRRITFWEGISLLVLLGIAMPLKYAAGFPLAVTLVGTIHGFLFLAFCYMLTVVRDQRRWPRGRVVAVFLGGLLPFGSFVIDRRLRAEAAG